MLNATDLFLLSYDMVPGAPVPDGMASFPLDTRA